MANQTTSERIRPISPVEAIKDLVDRFESKYKNRKAGQIDGIASGFSELDRITHGFNPGELTVIAGRPAMGKTGFLLSMALQMTGQNNSKVGYLDLAQNSDYVTERLIVMASRISAGSLRAGKLVEQDLKLLKQSLSKIQELPLFVAAIFDSSLNNVIEEARNAVNSSGLNILLIDYLQSLRINDWKGGRESETREIMLKLRSLAKELNIPIVLSSQLTNVSGENNGDGSPSLSDLGEGGAIEQEADKVILLYRPEYFGIETDERGNSNEGKAELILAKNRSGLLGNIYLHFIDRYALFEDIKD
jgi:replicative DNA helicase